MATAIPPKKVACEREKHVLIYEKCLGQRGKPCPNAGGTNLKLQAPQLSWYLAHRIACIHCDCAALPRSMETGALHVVMAHSHRKALVRISSDVLGNN